METREKKTRILNSIPVGRNAHAIVLFLKNYLCHRIRRRRRRRVVVVPFVDSPESHTRDHIFR